MDRDERREQSGRELSRRRVLLGTAVLGTTGLAGCEQIQSAIENSTGGGGGGSADTGPAVTTLTPADCEPETIDGDIETDTTWSASDCPRVALDGNVRVLNGATLTIESGVEVVGRSGARLTVLSEGTLTASGDPENPVWFYGGSDTTGYWQGINVRSAAPSEIDNVVVRNGGAGDWANVYLSGGGQAAVTNVLSERSATSGLVADSGTTLTDFATNEFRDNEDAALYIPTTLVGSIDVDSTYAGGNGTDAVRVFSNDVEDDATWPAAPYAFDGGNHRIFAAVSIDPGAQFTFGEGARITVLEGGSFTAEGTSDSPILFEGASATAGHWQGINLRSTNADNSLDNVEVAYGGAGDWANLYLSGGAQASVTNSTFRESATWGLYAEDGVTLEASNNTYENNAEGGVRTPEA